MPRLCAWATHQPSPLLLLLRRRAPIVLLLVVLLAHTRVRHSTRIPLLWPPQLQATKHRRSS